MTRVLDVLAEFRAALAVRMDLPAFASAVAALVHCSDPISANRAARHIGTSIPYASSLRQ